MVFKWVVFSLAIFGLLARAGEIQGLVRTKNCFAQKLSATTLLTSGHCVQADGKLNKEFSDPSLTLNYGNNFEKKKTLKLLTTTIHPSIAPSDKIQAFKSITEIADLAIVVTEKDDSAVIPPIARCTRTPKKGELLSVSVLREKGKVLQVFSRALLSAKNFFLLLKDSDIAGEPITVGQGDSGGGLYSTPDGKLCLAGVISIRDLFDQFKEGKLSVGATNVAADSKIDQWLARFIER